MFRKFITSINIISHIAIRFILSFVLPNCDEKRMPRDVVYKINHFALLPPINKMQLCLPEKPFIFYVKWVHDTK